jgi:hypothetical protein
MMAWPKEREFSAPGSSYRWRLVLDPSASSSLEVAVIEVEPAHAAEPKVVARESYFTYLLRNRVRCLDGMGSILAGEFEDRWLDDFKWMIEEALELWNKRENLSEEDLIAAAEFLDAGERYRRAVLMGPSSILEPEAEL